MHNERQSGIIRYLSEQKFARIEQLAEQFAVSPETIRRDLLDLEKDSSVKRVRGGAVFNNLRAQEVAYQKRMENNPREKLAIAHLACEYINDGEALALSNGTATLALARCLVRQKEKLTVVTNSPEIAMVLNENPTHSVYLTSGYLRKHNKSLVGSICQECLGSFRVDKAAVSIDGVSIRDGITEYNSEEAAVLKKMLGIAHTRMVLCEFSRFREVALNRVCPAGQIDYIFTDWNISSREIREWSDIGVKVLAAQQGDNCMKS